MPSKPSISVIVPVFKTERYLEKCLQSIARQTFKDFEVLCVNDCSPDGSGAILDAWQQRDSRFHHIRHEINLGLGGARNTALRLARADYIASVDSDDWVENNFLEVAYKGTEGGQHDIVCFGFQRVNETGKVISCHNYPTHQKQVDSTINIFRTFNPAFWNKLWLKSLYTENKIFFPNEIYGQDLATTPRVLSKARSINFEEKILYNYLVRENSATFSFDAKHYVDYIKVFDVLHQFLKAEKLWHEYKERFLSDVVAQGLRFHAENILQSDFSEARKAEHLRHLLLLREAYVRHNHDLSNLETAQLIHLIGQEAPISAVIQAPKPKVLKCSCMVKSFLRPSALERLLKAIGEVQYLQGFVFDEIIIGDDSPLVDKVAIHTAIRRAQYIHQNLRVRFIDLGENIGVSAGRNEIVRQCRNSTILMCDDDFILDSECQICDAFDQFKKSGLEIMGGWLKNKYNFIKDSWEYWGVVGEITETDLAKIYLLDERPQSGLVNSDYLLQFFFARRDTLVDCPWAQELHTEEHPEFFFRHWKRGTAMALSDKLFAKHTGDRKENPPRYNEFRHGKKNWEHYLFKSIQLSGKTVRRIYRWRDNEFRQWEVDTEAKTNKQKSLPLRPPILDQKVGLTRLTPRFRNFSFGYYDLTATSPDGRYALAQTIPTIHCLPDSREASEVYVIDCHNGGSLKQIGKSYAWCHQQASQLQFIPDGSEQIIYNDFDQVEQKHCSIIHDFSSGQTRTLAAPIAAVSPTGAQAASINFARLYEYRPGYGYSNLPDPYMGSLCPSNDGLRVIELETGRIRLVLSYEYIASVLDPEGLHSSSKWVINHVQYSPDGTKIFMLVRVFSEAPPYPTFSVVYDFIRDKLEQVFGFGSHYHWKDNRTICVSGSREMERQAVAKSFGVFEINVETKDVQQLSPPQFTSDGHCSYSPDRSMLLYDTYCDHEFPYRALYVYDRKINRLITLGYFWSDPELTGNSVDTRCDLHPRWSRDGKKITFDSTHEGFRAVYAIDVAEVRQVITSDISSMAPSDWAAWYKLQYSGKAIDPAQSQRELASFLQKNERSKQHLATEIQMLRNSTSCRITAPLRYVKEFFTR